MAKGWTPVRMLDFRIDHAAKNAAVAIKARGPSAAEQFLRRLAVHLDEVDPNDGLAPLEHPDINDPSRRRRRRREV